MAALWAVNVVAGARWGGGFFAALLRTGAVGALAVERDVVVADRKPLGQQVLHVTRTGLDVEHALALGALKVVVMAAVGICLHFVAWGLAWDVHDFDLA